jgi:hypothetical protein
MANCEKYLYNNKEITRKELELLVLKEQELSVSTIDSLIFFHELLHPFIEQLKIDNRVLYDQLANESIFLNQDDLSGYGDMAQSERIVRIVSQKALPTINQKARQNFLNKVFSWIKKHLKKIYGVDIKSLNQNTRMEDFIDVLFASKLSYKSYDLLRSDKATTLSKLTTLKSNVVIKVSADVADDKDKYSVNNKPYQRVTQVIKDLLKKIESRLEFDEEKYKEAKLVELGNTPENRKAIEDYLIRAKQVAGLGDKIHYYMEELFNGTDPSSISSPLSNNVKAKLLDFKKDFIARLEVLYPGIVFVTEQVVYYDSGSIQVAGRIDLLGVLPNGDVLLFDWKSSWKSHYQWSDSKVLAQQYQLTFYKQLLKANGINVIESAIVPIAMDIQSGDITDITLSLPSVVNGTFEIERIISETLSVPYTRPKPLFSGFSKTKEFMKKVFNVVFEETQLTEDEIFEAYKDSKWNRFKGRYINKSTTSRDSGSETKIDNPNFRQEIIDFGIQDIEEKTQKGLQTQRYITEKQNNNSSKKISWGTTFGENQGSAAFVDSVLDQYWTDYRKESDDTITFMWRVVINPEATSLGFTIMEHIYTKEINIIANSSHNLNQKVFLNGEDKHEKSLARGESGHTVGAKLLTPAEERASLLLESNQANIQLLSALMFYINNLSNDSTITSIVVISSNSAPRLGNIKELYKNLDTLNKKLDDYDSFKDFKLTKLFSNTMSHIDRLGYFYANLASKVVDGLLFNKDLMINYNTTKTNVSLLKSELIKRQNGLIKLGYDKLNDDQIKELNLISHTLLALENIDPTIDEVDIDNMQKNVVTPDEQRSPIFKAIRKLVMDARTKIRDRFVKAYDSTRLEWELFYEEQGKFRTISKNDTTIYNNLFEYSFVNGRSTNQYLLRDPDDTTYDYLTHNQLILTDIQKALLRKLIAQNKKSMESHYRGDENDYTILIRKLPLIVDNSFFHILKNVLPLGVMESAKQLLTSIHDNFISTDSKINEEKVRLYNSLAMQDLNSRAAIFEKNDPTIKYVDNIEKLSLLSSYMEIRAQEYNKVLPYINSLKTLLTLTTRKWYRKFDETEDLIKTYLDSMIFGKGKDGDTAEVLFNLISKLKTAASISQLGFNPATSINQFLTGFWPTISASFGVGADRFDFKHLLKAAKFMLGSKISKKSNDFLDSLSDTYNLRNDDIERLVSEMELNPSNYYWFSKWAMWLNQKPDHMYRTMLFLAEAIKDGSIIIENNELADDSAHTLLNDKLVYYPDKDKRFKDEGVKAHVINLLKKEDSYDGTNFTKGYTRQEIEAKQKLSNDIYANMSKEDKSAWENMWIGSAFMQFKRFILGKKNLYYTDYMNPVKENATSGKWVTQFNKAGEILYYSNGEPVVLWEGKLHEGILNTLMFWLSETKRLQQFPELLPHQNRNLSQLANDIGVFSLYMAIVLFAYDDEDKKDRTSTYIIANLFTKSMRDILFVTTPYNMVFQPASPASIALLNTGITKILGNLFMGDYEASGEAVVRNVGTLRTIRDVSNTVKYITGE